MKVRGARSIVSIFLSVLLLASIYVIIFNGSYAEAAEPAPVNTATSTAASAASGEVAAASGSNRFVVWQDGRSPPNTGDDIFFRRSTDNGATWKPAVNLSNNLGHSEGPLIAVSGSHVYVIWRQTNAEGEVPNIFFRHSADNGVTWAAKVKISTSITNEDPVPQLAASGSNVYVVWDDRGGNFDIFFRRSTDNGVTWKPIVQLVNNPGASRLPQVAVSGSNIYVIWFQANADGTLDDIFLRRSTDGGASWKSVKNLSNTDGGGCGNFVPHIAVSGSNAYVVWEDCTPGNLDIFFRRSTDNGATWKTIENLSNNERSSFDSRIAVSGSNVYVVWTDVTSSDFGKGDVLIRRSTDNGATWNSVKNLSNNVGSSADPQIAVSGSNTYVVWNDDTVEDYDIMFIRSTDNGATWKPIVNLSNSVGRTFFPQVATSGSNVFVVWMDGFIADGPDFDISFRRSTDNGATWKAEKNLSNNIGRSAFPRIAV